MKPPSIIPEELLHEYTLSGLCSVRYYYVDETDPKIQDSYNEKFTVDIINQCRERIKRKEVNSYWQTDPLVYQCLRDFSLIDKTVLVVGSVFPWYESMALEYGAKKVYVSEYADRHLNYDKIEYIKPHNIDQLKDKIDICISISSFEHDGLGRYGDPLNPNGDLDSMKKMKEIIKKDGLMFLAIPIGLDTIYFNIHRIYGKNRLPLLFSGYEVVKTYGFEESVFNSNNEGHYQPVYVLKNLK